MTSCHLGYTGTQLGMNRMQLAAVEAWCAELALQHDEIVAHHGMCVGGDEQFHHIARRLGFQIVGWPCDLTDKQAQLTVDQRMPVTRPLIRNRRMVVHLTELLAAPAQRSEVLRSGTWATVRAAYRAAVPVTIVYPDGWTE